MDTRKFYAFSPQGATLLAGWLVFAIVLSAGQARDEDRPASGLADIVERPGTPPRAEVPAEGDAPAATVAPDAPPPPDLKAKLATLMVITLSGTNRPNSADMGTLREHWPGAVLVQSGLGAPQAAQFMEKLRIAAGPRHADLVVGTALFMKPADWPGLAFPGDLCAPLCLGAAGDETILGDTARVVAARLRAHGFRFHLGPSLSLASSLPGAAGSLATFGADPSFAALAAKAFADAFAEQAVAFVPMDFPGGAENRLDDRPAVLLTHRDRLMGSDLAPWARAVESRPPAVHVGTMLTPTLDDDDRPACLSPAVIEGILRGELGYEGAVIAGPLDSDQMLRRGNPAEAALQALQAGADMLYWHRPGTHAWRTVDYLARAIDSGDLDPARVDAAYARAMAFRRACLMPDQDQTKGPKPPAPGKVLSEGHRQSITLLRNRGGVLPLSRQESLPGGITGTTAVPELFEILEKKRLGGLRRQILATPRHMGEVEPFEVDRVVRGAAGARTMVCLFHDIGSQRGQVELLAALRKQGTRVVVVWFGYPGPAAAFTDLADAVVLVYAEAPPAKPVLEALGDILTGEGPIAFLPVVRSLDVVAGQERSFNIADLVRSPAGRLPVGIDDAFPAGYAVSSDPSAALRRVRWDFGDGRSARGTEVTHAYRAPGNYPVTVTATDQNGNQRSTSFEVVARGAAE